MPDLRTKARLLNLREPLENIKRRLRPMLSFKSYWTARVVLEGIELADMLRKGQLASDNKPTESAAEAFYGLAA